MRITHLSLKNWRTFKNLDVGQRLVVIGPNASGKPNLLDAVRFSRDLSSPGGGLQDAVASRGGLGRVRCLVPQVIRDATRASDAVDDHSKVPRSRLPARPEEEHQPIATGTWT